MDAALDAFLRAAPERLRTEDEGTLSGILDSLRARVESSWPGIDVDRAIFYAFLGARVPDEGSIADAVASLHAGDLFLTCACLEGNPAALVAFEHRFAGDIIKALARFRLSSDEEQDLIQSLRVAFFVNKALAKYSGRGQLRAWVRATAVRTALNVIAARKPHDDRAEEVLGSLPATGDAELDLIRRRFRAEFGTAFAAAVASLDATERGLLAQHYVDGLTIDQLGEYLRVNRATVARRIAQLRATLLERTRKTLMRALDIDRGALESLMDVARSQLDISVYRLLKAN
jgi:RNA polymerase sigma-70 factor (ECF subfamily)